LCVYTLLMLVNYSKPHIVLCKLTRPVLKSIETYCIRSYIRSCVLDR